MNNVYQYNGPDDDIFNLKHNQLYHIVIRDKNQTGTDTGFIYVWRDGMYHPIPFANDDYVIKNWSYKTTE